MEQAGTKASGDNRGAVSFRYKYLDICRVISIFSIVLLHCLSMWMYPVGSPDWIALSFYNSALRFCLPMFFMVSGALILNPEKLLTISDLYMKRILRFFSALLFWTLLYYIIVVYLRDPDFNWANFEIFDFTAKVLAGHPHHHWFLFAIIAAYICVPVLRLITADKKITRYFLIAWGIFEIGLYTIDTFSIIFPNLTRSEAFLIDQVFSFVLRVKPLMFAGLIGYMVLGFYLHRNPPRIVPRRILYALGILGLVITVVTTNVISMRGGELDATLFSPGFAGIFTTTAALFVFFKSLCDRSQKPESRFLITLSECSFGVFLVHDFSLVFLGGFGFSTGLFPSVISPVIVTSVHYALSFCVVYALRKNSVFRRYFT